MNITWNPWKKYGEDMLDVSEDEGWSRKGTSDLPALGIVVEFWLAALRSRGRWKGYVGISTNDRHNMIFARTFVLPREMTKTKAQQHVAKLCERMANKYKLSAPSYADLQSMVRKSTWTTGTRRTKGTAK